jgi:hypothetical protein
MFIDIQKISQINRQLTAYSLNSSFISKKKELDKIIKEIIRLFIPCKSLRYFDEFFDAIESKRDFSLVIIQNIVIRLREIFSYEIKKIERAYYKKWIEYNRLNWSKKIDFYQEDKLIYSLSHEA